MQFSSPLYTLNPQYSPFQPPDYTGMRDAFSSQPLQSFNDLMPGQLYDVPQDITNQVPSINTVSSTLQNSILKPASVSNTPISYKQKSTTITPTTQQKFQASTFGKNYNLWNTGLNTLNTAFTGLFGEKNAYSGEKGSITRGMDSAYDTIQNNISQIGPVGQLISLGMGANKLLGNVTSAIGGGTDGMTTTDAILDSSLSQLTGVGLVAGLVNGFGGKKADTITRDNLVWEDMASSYSGSNNTVDEALKKSGKKYGLFSSGARHDANNQIAEAKRQQELVSDIQDEATDRFDIAHSSTAINGLRRKFALQGGYDISGIRVGKNGMSLDKINRTKSIIQKMQASLKFQNGGTIQSAPTEIELVNPLDIPEFQQGGQVNVKSRTLQELIEYAKQQNPRFIQRMSEPFKYVEWDDENGHHFGTHELGYTEMNGKYFIYPHIQEDSNGNLVRYPQDKWREAIDNAFKNKNGLFFNTEEEAKLFTESGQNPDDTFYGYKSGWSDFFKQKPTGKYQNGGAVNVIPEGALHARKHNMDMEGITKKGIPVVSEKDNGKVEQQAEIEREEIIFRLEVTKKLEELQKKFYDENSSKKEKDQCALEAGKLLTDEILNNTVDNTNNLL